MTKRLSAGLVLLFLWLKMASVFIVFLLCLIISFLVIVYSKSEFCARIIGFLFQFIGYLCSYAVLRRAEAYYNYPSTFKRLIYWLKSFPFLKKKTISGSCNVVAPSPEMYAEGHRGFSPNAGDLIDRIKAVEDFIPFIEGRITHVKQMVDLKINNVEDIFYRERNLRIARDEKIESMLKDGAVGGAVLIEVGIAYFLVGTIISSFSSDFILWLK